MRLYVDSFLELIYPEKNTCFICEAYDESIGDKYICADCIKKLKIIRPPVCIKCSKPINYSSTVQICHDCSINLKHFEITKSPFLYEGLIKKIIYDFKYYNKSYFYKLLGSLLVTFMKEEDYIHFDFITAVPLYSSKLKNRGYNQSELIAKYISDCLNITYINLLKRNKKTAKQSEQSKEERKKNLKNAFSIKKHSKKIINKSILLVDDIYTTGTTADECSKVLLHYGVKKVFVLTAAR